MVNRGALKEFIGLGEERRKVLESYNATKSHGLTHIIQRVNLSIYLKYSAEQMSKTMARLVKAMQ